MVDDLTALLNSREWVKRRVDRVEFLDLLTVRRTIALTLDLEALGRLRSGSAAPTSDDLVPLGWFVPRANSGTALVDADERAIPFVAGGESDSLVRPQIAERLRRLGLSEPRLDDVLAHRTDPQQPSAWCRTCRAAEREDGGQRELMAEKWGCPAVLELLVALHWRTGREPRAVANLARILLAWQTNSVVFACLGVSSVPGNRVSLRLSFEEELTEWEPPWERRQRALGRRGGDELSPREERRCRERISRGGPFSGHLNALAPGRPLRWLAYCRSLRWRKVGRRGMPAVAWHVAWHQASGLDVARHYVDIVLPDELTVVRMRMLRTRNGRVRANVADQTGSRATIVAPEVHDGDRHDGLWAPTLLSLTITQRSPASWFGGALIAVLTGIALLVLAWGPLRDVVRNVDAGTAGLLLAPTFVATVLSVRAASDIAEQLGVTLRWLIAAVGILAAAAAAALVAQPGPTEPNVVERVVGRNPPIPGLELLRVLWSLAGGALLLIAAVLAIGGVRIRRLIDYGRRPSARRLERVGVGEVLNPEGAPRIPPPDRWLNVDEGDLIPWGWLEGEPDPEGVMRADRSFWRGHERQRKVLVEWVRGVVRYRKPGAG